MSKIYTKTTWVNETLAGAERFSLLDNIGAAVDSFADLAQCQITLETSITVPGTVVDADRLNNIENGIDGLDTLVDIHGATGKTTPIDADETTLYDSTDGSRKKLTWANLKATLLTPQAWVTPTLDNSWVQYGSRQVPQYFKDPMGIVHLRGVSTGGADLSSPFTLPLGYRPDTSCVFSAAGASGEPPNRVEIISTGVISIYITSGGTSTTFFDGITFRVA